MCKSLKEENGFAKSLAGWMSDDMSDEQKKSLKEAFELDYGAFAEFCNIYLRKTVKAIKKGRLTIEGVDEKSIEGFDALLKSEKLDKQLRQELRDILHLDD